LPLFQLLRGVAELFNAVLHGDVAAIAGQSSRCRYYSAHEVCAEVLAAAAPFVRNSDLEAPALAAHAFVALADGAHSGAFDHIVRFLVVLVAAPAGLAADHERFCEVLRDILITSRVFEPTDPVLHGLEKATMKERALQSIQHIPGIAGPAPVGDNNFHWLQQTRCMRTNKNSSLKRDSFRTN
jgi:hypothetical protein